MTRSSTAPRASRGHEGDLDLMVLEVSAKDDPGGARLRATLEAHFEVERKQLLRTILLHGTILFSLPLWLAVARPALVPLGLRHLAMLTWAICAAGGMVALVSELHWRRRLLRLGPDQAKLQTDQP
jgi:hypothetical protein